ANDADLSPVPRCHLAMLDGICLDPKQNLPGDRRYPRALELDHLTLRRPRGGRLEGWRQARCSLPPFETQPCGPLLRVRVVRVERLRGVPDALNPCRRAWAGA